MYGISPPLGSLDSVRPAFMIVMGIFLIVFARRISKSTPGWSARMIVAGAFLLAFGYSVVLPLYEAGKIERISRVGHYHGSAAAAMAWHWVKLATMNSGWLLFGLGLAIHAKIFAGTASHR